MIRIRFPRNGKMGLFSVHHRKVYYIYVYMNYNVPYEDRPHFKEVKGDMRILCP